MRALVTGSARRLGRAMALYLAKRGYDVAVHYSTSSEDARAVAGEIETLGQRAATLRADLSLEAQVSPLVDAAGAALGGPISVLINNAAIFEHDTLENSSREAWDRHMEINLRAPVVLTQAFAAQAPKARLDNAGHMRASALVVQMLDQRVRKLTPEFMSYTVAKMGLWAFTRTAALAMAPHVRCNAIGPGFALPADGQSPARFERQAASTPLGRGGDAQAVTSALGYFMDAPDVTGQLLCLDGGQHLAWQTPDIFGPESEPDGL